MSRRTALALVGGAAALIVVALLVLAESGEETESTASPELPAGEDAGDTPTDPEPEELIDEESIDTVEASLYFPGEHNDLYPELRDVAASDDGREMAATLVQELISGPTEESLTPILEPGLTITGVLISAEGVAYVDLRSDTLLAPPVTGSTQEALTIYSVVQTLVHNVPEIESVVFLWNGRQRQTFGGHIDTTHPLAPDPDLVATALRPPA